MNDTVSGDFGGAGPDRVYREFIRAGTFRIQRCTTCEKAVFYPRTVCPCCGGAELSWFAPSGSGTVYSTTVIRRKPEKGGNYNVAVVELAEGPRLMTRVENIAPEQVRIGMAVSARITGSGDDALLVFVPAGGAGHE